MYLIFMDGSGNTGSDLTHPVLTIHYLLGLAVPGDQARALEDAATRILETTFGAACRAPGFECKGSDMYRGEGPCASMSPTNRILLYEKLLRLIPAHDVDVIWHGIDKPKLAARYTNPMHPHHLAFLYFAEDAERLLRAKHQFGLLISDEEKAVEQQVIEDLPRYKQLGTAFGYKPLDLTRIVDNVHWVKSHDSRLLQLTDVCTYLCQRYRRDSAKSTASAATVKQLWGIIAPRVRRGRIWPP
jgi:hypothetical protein